MEVGFSMGFHPLLMLAAGVAAGVLIGLVYRIFKK
jgi:hypothetical protein